jgi:hypothetical protein
VSEDYPARFIRSFVDILDLRTLGFCVPDSDEMRPDLSQSHTPGKRRGTEWTEAMRAVAGPRTILVTISGNYETLSLCRPAQEQRPACPPFAAHTFNIRLFYPGNRDLICARGQAQPVPTAFIIRSFEEGLSEDEMSAS